ncbi:ABC-2 type transport system ATP-binding protein [Microbacterium sp. LKL04]|nr:ABC transporter ATP-binding protein [Microbacterium sp. LKL04]SCY26459.1 ABC-2 type transport system ATP-binding protein [Microbacterium sp. LKL04]
MSGAGTALPPPPPLPADVAAARGANAPADEEKATVALPPKPDLPASVAAAQFEGARTDLEVHVGDEGEADTERQSETELTVEPEPEPEPTVEPVPEPEPEPEPTVEPVPEREPDPGPDPEPEFMAEPDPEPEFMAEPDPEPEFMAEPEPELEPEDPAPVTAVLPATEEEDVTQSGAAPALRMSKVSKSFGRTLAVDAVDLEIPAGTFYGIVGPNGAGKTTTLSMIAGLLRPDGGSIQVGGVDLRRDPRGAKALMGVLPDRLRTFDRLTGRQLLHYYGVLRGLRPAVVTERTQDLARAFDLTAALARPVSDYSAGMTKKIMLAGAMIHAPRLLVLDEPFEAVDPVSSAVILDILSAYVARGGTVVLSSHGMELVERMCDGVAVIVAGQVLAQGTVDEVRGDKTLAERFVQLSGGLSDVEGLEWLHTYSD